MPSRGQPGSSVDIDANIVNEDEYVNNSIRFKDSTGAMQNVVLDADEVLVRAGGEISKIALSASEILGKKATGNLTNLSVSEVEDLLKTLIANNSIRFKNSSGNMADLTLAASQVAGRKATGEITNLSGSDLETIIGLPLSSLWGLDYQNNSLDSNHDIDVFIGKVRSDDNTENIELASTLTKQIDAVWAVGDGVGGLDSNDVAVAADTSYAVWLIKRTDTGVVDVFISTNFTSPTLPANYDKKRRIGYLKTDGSANIRQFFQKGLWYRYQTSFVDVSDSTITSSAFETGTMSCPPHAILYFTGSVAASGGSPNFEELVIRRKGSTDVFGSSNAFFLVPYAGGNQGASIVSIEQVDENSELEYAANEATSESVSVTLRTKGFIDIERYFI